MSSVLLDSSISNSIPSYIDQDVLTSAGVTEANIHYAPVDNSQGFWMFNSTSATVNGQSIALSGNTAIADTGTTLALVSDSVCQAIYNAIPGGKYDSTQQGYVFPDSVTADQLPVVQFDVGGQLFTLQKEDLSFADAGSGMVYGGVQSRGSNTFDILGDTVSGLFGLVADNSADILNSSSRAYLLSLTSETRDLALFREWMLRRTCRLLLRNRCV